MYQTIREHLQLNLKRKMNYPWPTTIGIDERFFSRSKGFKQFATVVVDYNNKRVRELALGRSKAEITQALKEVSGRENVKNVLLPPSP